MCPLVTQQGVGKNWPRMCLLRCKGTRKTVDFCRRCHVASSVFPPPYPHVPFSCVLYLSSYNKLNRHLLNSVQLSSHVLGPFVNVRILTPRAELFYGFLLPLASLRYFVFAIAETKPSHILNLKMLLVFVICLRFALNMSNVLLLLRKVDTHERRHQFL